MSLDFENTEVDKAGKISKMKNKLFHSVYKENKPDTHFRRI